MKKKFLDQKIRRRDFFKLGGALAAAAVASRYNWLQPLPSVKAAGNPNVKHGHVTPAERRAAAGQQAWAAKMNPAGVQSVTTFGANTMPDYFGPIPNYANSPLPSINLDGSVASGGIHKFIAPLPFPPVAVPDPTITAYDYYELGLVQATQVMHPDLPATTFQGYVQLATANVLGTNALTYLGTTTAIMVNGNPAMGVTVPTYMGPTIIAQKDKPVRIKFYNLLPTLAQGFHHFLPIDTTYMGAGMGPTGVVSGLILTSAGSGYSSTNPPTLTFSAPQTTGGITATAVATVLNGAINTLQVTEQGSGYTIAPTVTISGTGGAIITALIATDPMENVTENRASLHLHGGVTPWISDGTPHQWFTPAGEVTSYTKGPSFMNLPDMPDPGDGAQTLFYSNQQNARLMFYHDHAYGTTRHDVYIGEAAPYILRDTAEASLISGSFIPNGGPDTYGNPFEIPLVIQDRTFVDGTTGATGYTDGITGAVQNPLNTASEDPTWGAGSFTNGQFTTGDMWFPHVYMPNQNPYINSGANAGGRWDYGPWFWPPFTGMLNQPVTNPLFGIGGPWEGPVNPGTPTPSGVPESFVDTPIVNGMAYPVLNVDPVAYRFRILNACNDRYLNLQMYLAYPDATLDGATGSYPLLGFSMTNMGAGYTTPPVVTIGTSTLLAIASIDTPTGAATGVPGAVTAIALTAAGQATLFSTPPTVSIAAPTGITGVTSVTAAALAIPVGAGWDSVNMRGKEVKMIPAAPGTGLPANWPTDGRDGGVPDPTRLGPHWFQIGNEGGFLPQVADIAPMPVGYEYNRRSITVLNVDLRFKCLYMGPAERADVIVDFSQFAGKTLIMYNDAPAPMPAFDPRNDYYTCDPNNISSGGAPTTMPGYGPNTRTIMQINVGGTVNGTAFNLAGLQGALPLAYSTFQAPPIVPQTAYDAAFPLNGYTTDNYVRIQDTAITVPSDSVSAVNLALPGSGYTSVPAVTIAPPTIGVTALAVAVLVPTTVAGVTLNTSGSGYTVAPIVNFSGGGGSGASATATLQPTSVGTLSVTGAGTGYTAAPVVTIAPPTAGTTATATATPGGDIGSDHHGHRRR